MSAAARDQLVFIGSLRMGGGEAAVRNLLLSLPEDVRARCQVALLSDPGAAEHERALGLPVVNLGARSVPEAALRLRRLVDRGGVRRVHAHLTQCIIAADWALAGRSVELVVFIHSFGTWKQQPGPWHRLRIALERRAVRGRATQVVYVSQLIRERHERELGYPAGKGLVIPNLLAGEAPRAHPRGGRDLRLVSVGRVERVKGFDWVLDAPDVADLLRGLRWTILGDGAHLGELRRLAAAARLECLELPGRREGIPELLPDFDAFFMPSLSEGLSVALLEACRAGLPLLCTDVGSNREVVEDGVNGRLIPVGDRAALARALEELRDPTIRADWAAGSLKVFAERFAPAQVLPRLAGLFT